MANSVIQKQLHHQLQSLSITVNTAPQLLHLTSLLIFQALFKLPLYVSGKFVPMILTEIKSKLEPEQQQLLETVHESIMNNDREGHLDEYKKLRNVGLTYAPCT
jgi:Na+/glutamate symporter